MDLLQAQPFFQKENKEYKELQMLLLVKLKRKSSLRKTTTAALNKPKKFTLLRAEEKHFWKSRRNNVKLKKQIK